MFTKHKFIIFSFCFILCFIYLYPQIKLKQPNLLDIAENWSLGTNIVNNSIENFADNTSRFRPIYVFERSSLNLIFNYNNSAYFFVFCILLSTTIFLIIQITNHKLKHRLSIICTILLVLISPVTVDTYWRLGTAENVFALILLLCIFFLIKKKYRLLILSLIILMCSKETSVLYIPLFLESLAILKRYKEVFYLSIFYTLYIIKIINLIIYANSHPYEYTALYSKSIMSLLDMFIYYVSANFFYIVIFLISVFLLIKRTKKLFKLSTIKKIKFEIFLIATILMGITSLTLFENKGQPYYFFPTMVTILLFYFWELKNSKIVLKNISVFIIIILFFSLNIPNSTLKRAKFWHNDYTGDGVLIELIENTKREKIYKFSERVRGEYLTSLKFLYDYDDDLKNQYQKIGNNIKLISKTQTNSAGTKLCGTSFFGETVCKWTIQDN